MYKLILVLITILLSIGGIYGAWVYPTPDAAAYQTRLAPLLWGGSITLTLLLIISVFKARKAMKLLLLIPLIFSLITVGMMTFQAWQFQQWQQTVLTADPATLKRLGNHFIIGYRDDSEIQQLAKVGAIAGIYITTRNIRGKSATEIREFIDQLQQTRQSNHLPPLIITADQEGGLVSRMSPPLPKYPTLAETLTQHPEKDHYQIAYRYGEEQGQGLASLGITLNLSPVVDLIPERTSKTDKYSLIYRRAISRSPEKVINIADAYIKGMESKGVNATLKHFPGLGSVYGDTHLESADLKTSIQELENHDWQPFKRLTQTTNAIIMVGHVHLTALDPELPTSLSKTVIQHVIRERWGYRDALMTDDMTMDAVYKLHDDHLMTASKQALDAGINYLLISYDVRQFYPAMASLLQESD